MMRNGRAQVLAEDKVANIRQKVAVCLLLLQTKLPLADHLQIKSALSALKDDKDIEVLRTVR